MDAHVGTFASRVEAGHDGRAVDIGLDTAHDVVHTGTHRYRLLSQIDPEELDRDLLEITEAVFDEFATQMSEVEENVAVDPSTFVDFRLLRARYDISGR